MCSSSLRVFFSNPHKQLLHSPDTWRDDRRWYAAMTSCKPADLQLPATVDHGLSLASD